MTFSENLGNLQFAFASSDDTLPVFAPKAGNYVEPDGWQHARSGSIGDNLICGDDIDRTLLGATFRLPTGFSEPLCTSLPVNIRVTGSKGHNVGWHRYKVRVEIEWVKDCEASEFSRGWMFFNV